MSDERSDEHRVTLLEIAATSISALLVVFLVSVLVWDAMHPDLPASFSVEARLAPSDERVVEVRATIRNVGDKSAKDVVVHVAAQSMPADTTLGEVDLTVDWLPGHSTREVVGTFSRGAVRERVEPRADVRGYDVP